MSTRHPALRGCLRRLVPALVCLLALTGCRLDVTGELLVSRDGSGQAGLELQLDAEAVARLDELAVDPFAELTAAAVTAEDWEVTRTASDDGGLGVRLVTEAGDPDALTATFDELVADLADQDPALLVDLDLDVDDDGAAVLTGTAELRPPATAGARRDGEPVGPEGDELAALVADAVEARLVVGLPGPVVDHDADTVTGGGMFGLRGGQRLTWDVPVGEPRTINARSDAPAPVRPVVIAGGIGAAVVIVGLLVWWWRRRRSRPVTRAG